MSKHIYQVVEEKEGHPQYAYSRIEVNSEYDNAEDALHYLGVLNSTFPNDMYHVRVVESDK